MRVVGDRVRLSASDLVGWLACRHLAGLEVEAARGARARPHQRVDPALELLWQRGLEHEKRYVESLGEEMVDQVEAVEAMRRGTPIIVQAALDDGRWFGRADILRRVERPSRLGPWSYEVIDTKLAGATRARTILQLCLYTDLVAAVQGVVPDELHVVAPGPEGSFAIQSYRSADFMAYYRQVVRRLEAAVPAELARATDASRTYPDPVEHCDICRWWAVCNDRRRADDSVWLVAGVTRAHRRELEGHGVSTLVELARHHGRFEPERVSRDSMGKVHGQARVQLTGRVEGRPVHELLPAEPGRGLSRLPSPSPGDLFFDIEGDRMGIAEGREFLFGLVRVDGSYECRWAFDARQEREAFEWVVEVILDRWARDPGMHVYHYAPYEPAAMKRLMGRYARCEDAIDRMLRAGRFVDLCGIVKQGLRASVERYSIKDLEPFYRFERAGDLRTAGQAVRAVQLALGAGAEVDAETRRRVEAYNRDDCVSAIGLRGWLESLRGDLPRPVEGGDGEPEEKLAGRLARVKEVAAALVAGVADDPAARSSEEQARWLLAQMLDYHRREEKVAWWEFFRLCSLTGEELIDERAGLGGLEYEAQVGMSKRKLPVHRYRFPEQDSEIDDGDHLKTCPDGDGLGEVIAIDRVRRTIDIRKAKDRVGDHPAAVFTHVVLDGPMDESLLLLGEQVVSGSERFAAALSLLRRGAPRVGLAARAGEGMAARARRLARELDGDVLPIQGPPGAGKTWTAARMILELAAAKKKVGVTAISHKVIRNLLEEVARAAAEEGVRVGCVHKCKEPDPTGAVTVVDDNGEALAALGSGAVVGGTTWLWADRAAVGAVDVLFVDEAGQMALANALAAAPAARSLVLIGDPCQLEQPQQGAHPDGVDVSALEHLLGSAKTIGDDRGLFLDETWRLAPAICRFTSELFYEGRLHPRAGLENQALEPLGAGLFFVPVDHRGNRNASGEEAEVVRRLVARLLAGGSWTDGARVERRLEPRDILVVAPYNAQVDRIGEALAGTGVRVGTVDKFQGQEAPVVIFSTATSTPDDAPRGMEFLYSPNRLNVATSRARCAVIFVASPALFEPECRTPRQVQLANAFCRYLELATPITP
jgi:predicted RecB family nuclease